MKKCFRDLVVLTVLACLMAGSFLIQARAAGSVRISFTDVDCKVGETFSVNMSVHSSDVSVGSFNVELQYPTDYLEFVSCSVPSPGNFSAPGGGKIVISWNGADGSDNVNSTLRFKALKSGSTSVTVANHKVADKGGDTVSSSAASSEITIGEGNSASNDATLSALKIAPGTMDFSPDKTDYSIQVNNDVERLTVTAKTRDANAKFVISSTDLKVGDNTITVKVTAADGKTTKTYTIKVKRAEGAATTSTTSGEKTTGAEETTKEKGESPEGDGEPGDDLLVSADGLEMRIVPSLEGVTLPEGYEPVEYEYDGKKIQAAKSLSGNTLLMYLSDQDGENFYLYSYNESDKTFTRMMSVSIDAKVYTVLQELDDGVIIPDNYHPITVEIGGVDFPAWQSDDDIEGGYYLIYAMNWDGERAIYRYDSYERTMQRADERLLISGQNGTELESGLGTENIGDLQSKLDEAEEDKEDGFHFPGWMKYVVIAILALVIIAAVMFLAIGSSKRGKKDSRGRGGSQGSEFEYDEGDDFIEFDEYEYGQEEQYPWRKGGVLSKKNTQAGRRTESWDGTQPHRRQQAEREDEEEQEEELPKDIGSSDLGELLNELDHSGSDDDFEFFDL